MFWKMKSPGGARPNEPKVVAIDVPVQNPTTDIELWVVSVLRAQGSLSLNDLMRLVRDYLYRDALGHGAASVDIGLIGVKLFDAESAAELARGDGRWWMIGKADDGLVIAVGRQSGDFAIQSEILR